MIIGAKNSFVALSKNVGICEDIPKQVYNI